MKKDGEKFEFNLQFQWDIIRYTLTEKKGYKAFLLYKAPYFDLIDQQVIVKAIERYYKKRGMIPGRPSILLENLKPIYRSKQFVQSLKDADRKRIDKRAKALYKRGVKDKEEILEAVVNFASYTSVKEVMEKFDITQYDQYAKVLNQLQSAVNKNREVEDQRGAFMIASVQSRIVRRKFQDTIFPTPFRQFNNKLNAKGLTAGSVVVILDREKGGKTLSLVNVAKGYLAKQKKVAVFDFENGQEAYEDRIDQSIAGVNKLELLNSSKETEDKLKKIYRRYKRVGAELYIKRLPAGSTFNDVEKDLQGAKEDYGFVPQVLVMDYLILMGPIERKNADHENVSQTYIDAKTFVNKHEIECLWTANHVKREAYHRRPVRYQAGDAAKALDIGRHADVIMGVNQHSDETEKNILRWEIVEQRDGVKGPIVFNVDHSKQRLMEFTSDAAKNYMEKWYSKVILQKMDKDENRGNEIEIEVKSEPENDLL